LQTSIVSPGGHLVLADIESYVTSTGYFNDIAVTRQIWSQPAMAGTAGAYIFLLYLSLPILLDVRSGNGLPARSALDGERERAFLMNITGCTDHDRWRGGIRNQQVRRQANLLGSHHARFAGMRPEYLDFIGTVITMAPLEVQTKLPAIAHVQRRRSYWRYMNHAMSLLGADVGEESTARDRCLDFIDAYGAPSSEGSRLYASLDARHPSYVERAAAMLPAQAQAIVSELMKRATC
jgi:hypothetical protein